MLQLPGSFCELRSRQRGIRQEVYELAQDPTAQAVSIIAIIVSALAALGGLVTTLVAAAFRGLTARVTATEQDVAKLQQAQADDRGRQERIEKKVDDMAGTLHGIDNKLGVMVAQGVTTAHDRDKP